MRTTLWRVALLTLCLLPVTALASAWLFELDAREPPVALVGFTVMSDHCDPVSHIGACTMQDRYYPGFVMVIRYLDEPRAGQQGFGTTYNNRYDLGEETSYQCFLDRRAFRCPISTPVLP